MIETKALSTNIESIVDNEVEVTSGRPGKNGPVPYRHTSTYCNC